MCGCVVCGVCGVGGAYLHLRGFWAEEVGFAGFLAVLFGILGGGAFLRGA